MPLLGHTHHDAFFKQTNALKEVMQQICLYITYIYLYVYISPPSLAKNWGTKSPARVFKKIIIIFFKLSLVCSIDVYIKMCYQDNIMEFEQINK